MSKNPNTETHTTLSDETVKALMEQAGETIKKSVPAQTTEEPTVEKGDDVQASEDGDDTEKPSKLADLKSKTLSFLKNNKKAILISTGVTVALGVVIKIATGQSADEEELVDDADENDESETSEV